MERKARPAPPQIEESPPKEAHIYYDVYDDSVVTARVSGDTMEFERQDGRPMWHNGSSTLSKERWDSFVQKGFFLRVNPNLTPQEAARDIMRRTGEDI